MRKTVGAGRTAARRARRQGRRMSQQVPDGPLRHPATGPGDTDAPPQVLELGRHRFPPTARLIMAIVNRTPDSFYDRGATWDESAAMDRVQAVVADGAEIVDVGGVKAAPGEEVSAAEEIRRTASFVAE